MFNNALQAVLATGVLDNDVFVRTVELEDICLSRYFEAAWSFGISRELSVDLAPLSDKLVAEDAERYYLVASSECSERVVGVLKLGVER
jgi:hypothetical protein